MKQELKGCRRLPFNFEKKQTCQPAIVEKYDYGGFNMYCTTKAFITALEENDWKYRILQSDEEGKADFIRIGYRFQDIPSVQVDFIFDPDGTNVAVRVFDFIKVPEEKSDKVLSVINDLNCRWRFVKFVLNVEDRSIELHLDNKLCSHDTGEICLDLLRFTLVDAKNAYSDLMKVLWT